MNQEPEVGSTGKVEASPKEKLETAVREYVEALALEEPEVANTGMMTAWVLVVEEQNPVDGTCSYTRVAREHQSRATSMGLITYADERYRAMVRGEY